MIPGRRYFYDQDIGLVFQQQSRDLELKGIRIALVLTEQNSVQPNFGEVVDSRRNAASRLLECQQ